VNEDGLRLWARREARGAVERVTLWTQVLTGLELDEHGGVRVLDDQEWRRRREQLDLLGGPPLP
jgi:hypothetical protein